MDTLTKEQRDILLDYYFECADQREAEIAKQLLENHKGAREFFEKLHHSLSVLEHLDHPQEHSVCPDDLVERTLEKLYSHHSDTIETTRLERLLRFEGKKIATTQRNFWRRFAEAAAIAAVVFIVASIFVPAVKQMRQQSYKTACQANLSKIALGLAQYLNDHDGYLPAVSTKAGNPWWKVGVSSEETQSNTRHLWLLVKQGYVQPTVFVCPGASRGKVIQFDNSQIAKLFDFPSRQHITYSFKLICEPNKAKPQSVELIMSDANPLFESQTRDWSSYASSQFYKPIKLTDRLLRINSFNHNKMGQNIMFSDGVAKFSSERMFNKEDDIFTLKNLDTYFGTEMPVCQDDIFLVP